MQGKEYFLGIVGLPHSKDVMIIPKVYNRITEPCNYHYFLRVAHLGNMGKALYFPPPVRLARNYTIGGSVGKGKGSD